MRKVLIITFLLILYINANAQTVIVAVSANAQYALNDVIKLFTKKYPSIKVKKVVSSSGKLTNQIIKGAPFDIFLSADMKYPSFLYEKGFALNKPKVYAYGVIVIWTTKDIPLKKLKLKAITKAKKIAVANPKTAPYGKESIKILKKAGIFPKVKNKIIFGESISQVNYYILKGIVDVGFSSKSSVIYYKNINNNQWIEVDKNLYNPIKQGAVILKNARGKIYAIKFYNFLFSKEAKEIFKKYGYIVADE